MQVMKSKILVHLFLILLLSGCVSRLLYSQDLTLDSVWNKGLDAYDARIFNEALTYFNQFVQIYPTDSAYSLRAATLIKLSRNEEAMNDLNKAIELNPKYIPAHVYKGVVYLAQGDKDNCASSWQSALGFKPVTSRDYTLQAYVYLAFEQYNDVLKLCNKALEINSKSSYAHSMLGIAYWKLGKLEDALSQFTTVINMTSSSPDNLDYKNRGIVYFSLSRFDEAENDFSKAIELDPKDNEAYYYRGLAYTSLEKNTEGLNDLNKAIETDPKYADAYVGRGMIYEKLQKYTEALLDLSKAIELDPAYFMAYNDRSTVYCDLKKYDEAMKDIDKAISLDKKSATAYNNKGIILTDLKQYEDAIDYFTQAIYLKAKYAKAYGNRGDAYEALQYYKLAVSDWEKAISYDPSYESQLRPKINEARKKIK